ncbi:hypothetical protein QJQ45_005266 [Haematococcus lacustris]|nr:hypothetical protein QJQ45_005266 [Haematococcus lacustris]
MLLRADEQTSSLNAMPMHQMLHDQQHQRCKAHHIKLDTHAPPMLPADTTSLTKFRNGVAGPKDSEVANRWNAFLPNLAAVRPNVGQKIAQVVHSVMFIRPKPAELPGELPRKGKEEGAVNPLAPLDADWLGCDPRKTNMATVAHEERYPSDAVNSTVKGAKVRCNSAATGRPLALAYGAAGFSGSGDIGSKGVPVKQMQREACKQFPGRVVLVHEFRTSRVSSARTNVVQGQAESFKWQRPVRTMAKRSRIWGLMCPTSIGIRFYDRDVSAALSIRRIAAGPGSPRELSGWLGRPAMPNPGRPGQEWVQVRDKGLLRKWQRRHQRQR